MERELGNRDRIPVCWIPLSCCGGGAAGANAREGAKKVVSGGGDVAGSVRDGMEG
jgi:hypothetical protein